MAFCSNCGTQTDGAFCPNCGAPAGGGAPSSGTAAGPSAIQAPGLTENVASALCYLFGLITGIIFLLIAPYNQNRTIRFHAFQSIFAHLAVILIGFLLGAFGLMTHLLGLALFPLYWFAVVCLWLYLMFQAYNNRKIKLPVIGDLAEKQT